MCVTLQVFDLSADLSAVNTEKAAAAAALSEARRELAERQLALTAALEAAAAAQQQQQDTQQRVATQLEAKDEQISDLKEALQVHTGVQPSSLLICSRLLFIF